MVLHFGLIFLSFYYRLLKRIFGISNWTLHAKKTFFSKRWNFMTTLGLISWSIGKNSDFKTANLHFLSKVLWIIINFEKKNAPKNCERFYWCVSLWFKGLHNFFLGTGSTAFCASFFHADAFLGMIAEYSKGGVTRDNSNLRFLAQYSVATLLQYCFEWL